MPIFPYLYIFIRNLLWNSCNNTINNQFHICFLIMPFLRYIIIRILSYNILLILYRQHESNLIGHGLRLSPPVKDAHNFVKQISGILCGAFMQLSVSSCCLFSYFWELYIFKLQIWSSKLCFVDIIRWTVFYKYQLNWIYFNFILWIVFCKFLNFIRIIVFCKFPYFSLPYAMHIAQALIFPACILLCFMPLFWLL